MRLHILQLALIPFLLGCFCESLVAWDDKVTHRVLTERAVYNSSLDQSNEDILSSLGFVNGFNEKLQWDGQVCDEKTKQNKCNIIDWLRYGAEKEDADKYPPLEDLSVRPLNHFHEPISNLGLNGHLLNGMSALEWAQDDAAQSNEIEGDQSWSTLRNLFYIALTIDDGEDGSAKIREETYAQLFKGLGHQMHLVQDMAVPYHVRNDAHIYDSAQGGEWWKSVWVRKNPLYFETWAKKHPVDINKFAQSAGTDDFPNLLFDEPFPGVESPISQLWNANVYDGTNPSSTNEQGLAEYTSSNFFSEGTRFAAEDGSQNLPYPKRSSLEPFIDSDGWFEKVYLAKQGDGENVTHFVRAPYLYFLTYPNIQNSCFYLDENCHKDYAQKLVPRAVGYSAALLDYFFRGKMELMLEVSDQGDFLGYVIENKTEEEEMEGTFEIYYDNVNGERDKIWSGDLSLGPKDSDTSKSAPFTNLVHPEPGQAKEPGKYILVFRGKLGDELDAVAGAVSVLDSSEYVYVEIGERCLIWDIARNGYASITDAAGDEIDFPCDTSRVSEWLDNHPVENASGISWDNSPFRADLMNSPRADHRETHDCTGPVCFGFPNFESPAEVRICEPTPGLPGKEDCEYHYEYSRCCQQTGPPQECGDEDTDGLPLCATYFKTNSHREDRREATYRALAIESDPTLFGSYVGQYNGYEGLILNLRDEKWQSGLQSHMTKSYICCAPNQDEESESSYHSYEFNKITTPLGTLGEITVNCDVLGWSSIHTDYDGTMITNSGHHSYSYKRIDDSYVNKFKIGLVSEKSVLFIFLYQYRIRIFHEPVVGSPNSYSFERPVLLAQAAAKGWNDTSTINPFEVSSNSSLTNAIRVLVDDFYVVNGAQGEEILPFDGQIKANIRSQLIEGESQ